MKRALVLSLVILIGLAIAGFCQVGAWSAGQLYGGPGGLFFNGDATVVDGHPDFDLCLGGNGRYLDLGVSVRDCLTAPYLHGFAIYSDRWGNSRSIGFAAGLLTTFTPFADVQTAGLTWSPPFRLADFELFTRLEMELAAWLDLVSDLSVYAEFSIVPVWNGDAFTTGTRWAFGFSYQWTDAFVPREPTTEF